MNIFLKLYLLTFVFCFRFVCFVDTIEDVILCILFLFVKSFIYTLLYNRYIYTFLKHNKVQYNLLFFIISIYY